MSLRRWLRRLGWLIEVFGGRVGGKRGGRQCRYEELMREVHASELSRDFQHIVFVQHNRHHVLGSDKVSILLSLFW